MGEWKEYKLGDLLIKTNQGVNTTTEKVKYSESGIPVIRAKNIYAYKIDFNDIAFVDEDTYSNLKESVKPKKGDILYTNIGSQLGNAAKVEFENNFLIAWNVFRIQPDKQKVTPDFLTYLLNNPTTKDFIRNLDSSSTMPFVSGYVIEGIDFLIPPLPEQKFISSILSSLDDKIDLLHRQNKTLESLAETLFRQWFVEEAEEGWKTSRLGDILESIESGSRPKGGIDPSLKEGIPSIGAENINGLGVYDFSKTKFITPDFFKSMTRGLIKNYDVLIYKDGAYVGRKGMFADGFPYDICAVNEHVFILRANNRANQFFLYFLLQEDELAQLNANSAQPGLNQEAMKSLEIIIPPLELINQFEEKVKSLIDKVFFNCNQIRTLARLRDTLLPKLMSGEVRVKES